ncbi:MAG TPA: type II 3-dehydroquinate dehydratase [Bacillota bacterium]|nr:type II 3-dehydroquinate dehydratase [Bacillota bacterium]
MVQQLLLLNGPNLNMLGKRNEDIYGSFTLQDVENIVKETAQLYQLAVTCYQSNHEGNLVEQIQQANKTYHGVIFNPAAYSHTSIAIHDAIELLKIPIIEVHISNIYEREQFRQQSITAKVSTGQITGLGLHGYELATHAIARLIKRKDDSLE